MAAAFDHPEYYQINNGVLNTSNKVVKFRSSKYFAIALFRTSSDLIAIDKLGD
jgi:hypothetical protein